MKHLSLGLTLILPLASCSSHTHGTADSQNIMMTMMQMCPMHQAFKLASENNKPDKEQQHSNTKKAP